MIKYKYAKDENGKLIDIDSLKKEGKGHFKYFCICCSNEFIARLGLTKTHHFAHKKVVTCSKETYLHRLGKQLFYDNFTECLENQKPFFIEVYQKRNCNHYEQQFGIVCKLKKIVTKFDLTKHFDKITLETREGSFKPDLMLISKTGKDKLFIEIAVTHFSSGTKLSSEYRIIELEIKEEIDLEPIKRNLLSVKDSKVKFKNFKFKELNGSICNGNCEKKYNFFTLDLDGRGILKPKNLKQISHQINKKKNRIVKYFILKNSGFNPHIFKSSIANCAKEKLNVKNCFICRYHAENNAYQTLEETTRLPIFCKFLKIKCNSNQAVMCDYFKVEKVYVEELYKIGQELNEEIEELSEDDFYEDTDCDIDELNAN